MTLPKITVITPTFQTGTAIEKAILSVAGQTYQNTEHLIVDCLSKDKTLPTIRKYQKIYKNIRLLTEKDGGIYDAMNKGMELCTGDWIYFMGADDVFYDENILTDLYEQGYFQEEQIIYGNVIIKGDTPWAADNTVYDGPFTLEKLFRWNICHQSILYPRSVISKVGYYNTRYKVTSDWDYNVRCWATYKFTYTDKVIAYFAAGGKSSESGDYSLHLDFPDNVIKYFRLDINDSSLYQATSPFYYPMTRHRENEYLNNIRDLNSENEVLKQQLADRQSEHSRVMTDLQNTHESSVAALRAEFDDAFARMRTEHEAFLGAMRSENESVVADLKAEHDQSLVNLKAEHDQSLVNLKAGHTVHLDNLNAEHASALAGLKSGHELAVSGLKEEHEAFVARLRTEFNQVISGLKDDHEKFVAALKAGHAEAVMTLNSSYEEIIRSLQAEHRDFRDTVRQKEAELLQVISSERKQTGHLEQTLAGREKEFKETIEKYLEELSLLSDEINYKNREIAVIRGSYTWKTGRLLLAPLRFFMPLKKK